jgi:RHH-type rel operon transcriptional repressor/antitoxin RelB
MDHAISVRLPSDLDKALEKLAHSMDRSKTYLIRKALEFYLLEYADYQIAMNRMLDKNDRTIDSSELKKQLGL